MFFSITKYLSMVSTMLAICSTTLQALITLSAFPITDGYIESNDSVSYPLHVTQAGMYTFYSTYTADRVDLVGELYDVETQTLLASNVHGGSYNNFSLSYALEADRQYELRVHTAGGNMGSYVLHALYAPVTPVSGVRDDFSGDGIADILWRKNNGKNHLWIMDVNGSHIYKNIGGKRTDYHLVDTGDFNGDGITDILWRRKDGVNHIWYMNTDGSHVYKNIGGKRTSYHIVGTGDFNGDGISDICWMNSTTTFYIWYMNADGSHDYKKITGTASDTTFQRISFIASIADFDGDGISDIFWRHGEEVELLKMHANGTYEKHTLHSKNAVFIVVKDFNQDDIPDILWRQGDKTSIWYMHADYTHTYKNLGRKPLSYVVESTADFNGDGTVDILWRKTTGTNHIWSMQNDGSHHYVNIGGKHITYTPSQTVNPTWVSSLGELKYLVLKRRDVTQLNTSLVVDMHSLFKYMRWFNQDIGGWDVSNVANMHHMFYGAHSFNQDIGKWDVSSVIDMNSMFESACVFNQDIGKWDVSSVVNTREMFENTYFFNQNIGNWDVSSVKFMEYMFCNASAFNQNISDWDVSSVIWHYRFSLFSALVLENEPIFP